MVFAACHGEVAEECAEPYFHYGRALLELSKHETSGDDSDESEEEHKVVEESSKVEKESKTVEEEVVDSEDVGHLELAWEMLEMARLIWSKKSQVSWEAEALACLGDVSLQAENYALATTDLASCLQKRTAALPADSRCISETHYQLGVAQAHCGEWSQAEASLNAAIAVLETRVRNFAKVDKTEVITKEIAEVEAIIAGIKERVTDFKDMSQGVFREDMVEVVASSKLASGLGVEGAVHAAKPMDVATAGTA